MDNLLKAKGIDTNNNSQEEKKMESLSNLQMTIQTINQAPIDSAEFRQLEEEARRLNVKNAFMMNELISNGNGHSTDKEYEDGKLLNTVEISKYFNLAPKTIRKMANRGDIRCIKIPSGSIRGEWRFKKTDVERGLLLNSRPKRKTKVKEPEIW